MKKKLKSSYELALERLVQCESKNPIPSEPSEPSEPSDTLDLLEASPYADFFVKDEPSKIVGSRKDHPISRKKTHERYH